MRYPATVGGNKVACSLGGERVVVSSFGPGPFSPAHCCLCPSAAALLRYSAAAVCAGLGCLLAKIHPALAIASSAWMSLSSLAGFTTSSCIKAGKQISNSVNFGRTNFLKHSIVFYSYSLISLHLAFLVEVSFS